VIITKQQFDRYRKVQYSGQYNMFDQRAILATELDKKTYFDILKLYDQLEMKFGPYQPYHTQRKKEN